jgi:hypothetical protein
MNMRIPKPIPRGCPTGLVLPETLTVASSIDWGD